MHTFQESYDRTLERLAPLFGADFVGPDTHPLFGAEFTEGRLPDPSLIQTRVMILQHRALSLPDDYSLGKAVGQVLHCHVNPSIYKDYLAKKQELLDSDALFRHQSELLMGFIGHYCGLVNQQVRGIDLSTHLWQDHEEEIPLDWRLAEFFFLYEHPLRFTEVSRMNLSTAMRQMQRISSITIPANLSEGKIY